MAIYLVTGKLGSGKTLASVGRIRDALKAGKRVATNLNLNFEHLVPPDVRQVNAQRLPDKPTLADLEALGRGQDGCNEELNGLIVLDELGAWLNTRSWADKERQGVIDWFLHSRKYGWDLYLIIQHTQMVDKQVREGLAEFVVMCRRTDRIRLPFVGGLGKIIGGKVLTPPKIHVGTVRYGLEKDALVADRWWYRAHDLYAAYDTRQVFTNERVGPYSYLGPAYFHAASEPQRNGRLARWVEATRRDAQRRAAALLPKRPEVVALMQLPADRRVRMWRELSPTSL